MIRTLRALSLLLVMTGFYTLEASQHICAQILNEGYFGGHLGQGEQIDYELYAPFENILFLADGVGRERVRINGLSLAPRVADHFPSKKIYQGDVGIMTNENLPFDQLKHSPGEPIRVRVNNAEKFPFPNDSLDFVGMRKGICTCHGTTETCGGFMADAKGSSAFFGEIIRVLNLNNPSAMAILHGQNNLGVHDPSRIHCWRAVAEQLEADFPVQVFFVHAPPNFGFEVRYGGRDRAAGLPHTELNSLIIRPNGAAQESPSI